MGKTKRWQALVLICKFTQPGNQIDQLVADKYQPLPHQDHICVVAHITACGAQMDNRHGLGTGGTIGMDMCHYIVPQLFFLLRSQLIVHLVPMCLHLVDLFLRNGQPQFHLRPRQRNPQPVPGGKFLVR